MARRVFDTYHADDDEIEGVKSALDDAGVEFYETHKGFWGAGSAGIWIRDNSQFEVARKSIDAFQSEWQKQVREHYPQSGIRWSRVPVLILFGGMILYLNLYWFFLD